MSWNPDAIDPPKRERIVSLHEAYYGEPRPPLGGLLPFIVMFGIFGAIMLVSVVL